MKIRKTPTVFLLLITLLCTAILLLKVFLYPATSAYTEESNSIYMNEEFEESSASECDKCHSSLVDSYVASSPVPNDASDISDEHYDFNPPPATVLYCITSSTDVYDTDYSPIGYVEPGSQYTGYEDPAYPGYVVINYMTEKFLVNKSCITSRGNAKVLQTGTVGQMGGAIYGESACGPTAAAILVNSQKNADWDKDSLIIYAENNALNDQGSLRGGGGITAPNLIKLINSYSGGEYIAQNIYSDDPISILKDQIDNGNRSIIVVRYTSTIVADYASGTHFVVICGYEHIDETLYFYYADSYYGNGPRSILTVDAFTLADSINMVDNEPKCIITLK